MQRVDWTVWLYVTHRCLPDLPPFRSTLEFIPHQRSSNLPPIDVSTTSTHLFCGESVLFDAPSVAEAVPELEDGEDKLALGGTPSLQTGLESKLLDGGGIRRCRGQIFDRSCLVRLAAPAMSGERYSSVTDHSSPCSEVKQ